MSLGCSIEEVKKNSFDRVKELIETKNIKMDKYGTITFDYTNSNKFKTEQQAYNVAQSIMQKIEKWAASKDGPGPRFSKHWTTYNRNNNTVSFKVPGYVIDAYKRKFVVEEKRNEMYNQIQEARKQHIEDAKRAGIDESEFSDNYMYFQYEDDFDDMMDPDTQFNQEQAANNEEENIIRKAN